MRRSNLLVPMATVVVFLVVAPLASTQDLPTKGRLVDPPSTVGIPGLPRTPLHISILNDPTTPQGETPASIACTYGVTKATKGCPQDGKLVPNGGKGTIAVVLGGVFPFSVSMHKLVPNDNGAENGAEV